MPTTTTPSGRPRLGPDFAKLWAAGAVSNVGDGVTMAAGPLLVVALTGDPALVAGGLFAQQLPWLLFSLAAGAYVDRFDRRRLLVGVNLLRAAAVGGLAAAVAVGEATIPLAYAAFFLLGTGETLADNAAAALLPSVVSADGLERANARLGAVFIVGNQLAAKPVGAWLFVVAAALPFGFDAATFVVAAALVAAMSRRAAEAGSTGARRSLRAEVAEGVRWLWRHRLLRLFAVCLCLMNVTFCAAFAVFVLYARDRLGLHEVGYGVLLSTSAAGGLLGSVAAPSLQAAFGPGPLLRAGLVVEASTHLMLALTRTPWVAGVTLTVFGVHAMVWGVVTVSVRQRIVPELLRGRVNGVYALFSQGGAALGTLLGGLLARTLGLAAPFWMASVTVALLLVVTWRRFAPDALAALPPVAGMVAPAEEA